MYRIILLISAFFVTSALAGEDEFDKVQAQADAAFAKLDRAVDELEQERRAELHSYVRSELASLELDLMESGADSNKVAIVMKTVKKHSDPLVTNEVGSPQILGADFRSFMGRTRVRLGLVDTTSTTATVAMPTSTALLVATSLSQASTTGIFEARENADWSENLDKVPDDWWKRSGEVWTSADGKITFAVGKGRSRDISMARTKAEFSARSLLVAGDKLGLTIAHVSGATMVQWHPSKDGYYGLMAIPTSLLPQ
jgi:hypothetical protein|tara:strand:+ start:21246 stop:22010 length:765 start_codon:yes stop_codon:yes gene_type:complete